MQSPCLQSSQLPPSQQQTTVSSCFCFARSHLSYRIDTFRHFQGNLPLCQRSIHHIAHYNLLFILFHLQVCLIALFLHQIAFVNLHLIFHLSSLLCVRIVFDNISGRIVQFVSTSRSNFFLPRLSLPIFGNFRRILALPTTAFPLFHLCYLTVGKNRIFNSIDLHLIISQSTLPHLKKCSLQSSLFFTISMNNWD